jgi:chemotaxis protein methyltransferase CheR
MTGLGPQELFEWADFRTLQILFRERVGLELSDTKRVMVSRRLGPRIRELAVSSGEYVELVLAQNQECQHCIDAVTTHMTSFFREPWHFDFLKDQNVASESPLRLWSAGCSTGEEAYSIAISLAEAGRLTPQVKILATDVSSSSLETARAGRYSMSTLEGVSLERRNLGFQRGRGVHDGWTRIKPQIARPVSFRQHNLMEPWPMRGPFQAIFCRNVMIYFGPEAKDRILAGFTRVLQPGGFLFLGHSESLGPEIPQFRRVGPTTYQRCP